MWPARLRPAATTFDVWLGLRHAHGDSTYTIGGDVSDNQGNAGRYWDPLSELKWPLDVVMVSLGGRAEFGRFSVRGEIAKNATSDAGDMEDSDWGIYYDMYGRQPGLGFSPNTKDVYSTSSTDLDALIIDVRGRYAVWQRARFSTTVGLGLRYQKFSSRRERRASVLADVLHLRPGQVFPSDPFAYDGTRPGDSITR